MVVVGVVANNNAVGVRIGTLTYEDATGPVGGAEPELKPRSPASVELVESDSSPSLSAVTAAIDWPPVVLVVGKLTLNSPSP